MSAVRPAWNLTTAGVGGSHIGQASSDDLAIRIVRAAVDKGINFMDNSWDYNNGDGKAETRMGKALADGYRKKVFLMTKVDGRTKEVAAKQIDESLKRLPTDHVDLLQNKGLLDLRFIRTPPSTFVRLIWPSAVISGLTQSCFHPT